MEVTNTLINLTMVMISNIHLPKYQAVHFKYIQCLYVGCKIKCQVYLCCVIILAKSWIYKEIVLRSMRERTF